MKAFVRANGFDKIVIDPPKARIGIMTTGKAYLDTRQALEDLGIPEARARELGIRLYKVGVTWPIEPEGARRFAEGLEEVIVVEEKRSNLEDQLVRLLYNLPADRRPVVIGKTDEQVFRADIAMAELARCCQRAAQRVLQARGNADLAALRLLAVFARSRLALKLLTHIVDRDLELVEHRPDQVAAAQSVKQMLGIYFPAPPFLGGAGGPL